MFRNIGITLRFVVASIIAVVIVLAVTLSTTINYMAGILYSAEENEIKEIFKTVVAGIESEGRTARVMSALVAGIPEVQNYFASRDRAALEALFVPGFQVLKEEYGVRQFQFHEPPATSFLRVHKPAKFGDDLSSFRLTVVEGNKRQKAIQGLEVGVAGLGIRGLVPVSYEGQHVGTVEFGMSFGQAFFDEYAKHHEVDLELYINRDGKMDRFASTMEGNDLVTMDALKGLSAGKHLFNRGELDGKPVSYYAAQVESYSGEPIGVLLLAKDRTYFANSMSNMTMRVVGLGLLSVTVIGILVWLISRGVVKPICDAVVAMEGIASAKGDLTVRMDESGSDEVTRLSRAYNHFAEKTEEMINKVSMATANLSMRIGDFAALAEHTKNGINQQHEQTTQVATAMTEMSATVHDVAQNTTQTAEAAREADQLADSGHNVVNAVSQSIDTLASEVGRAVDTVQIVEKDSERIGSVLDVIRGIADQTNLLALNAAIEAARAGEQGRGFAVVADEVRTLAKRTQDSTAEIQEMIESLQSGVHKTVKVMEASQYQASESVEQAGRALKALEEITRVIDTISQMSAHIATAAEEQSSVAEDINRNIVDITHVAEATSQDAAKSYEASEAMSREVDKLTALLAEFNTGDGYVSQLQRAIAAHLSWKTKLRGFLDGKGSLDERVAFNHKACGFGVWYESVGRKELAHIREINEVEKPHRELHETIKLIAKLKKQGDLQAAEKEYQRVGPLSEEIVSMIQAIQSKLN